jgi:uncharacterized protein YlaI
VRVKKARPQQRFRDDGRSLFDGLDDIRVKCPKCGAAGRIARIDTAPARTKALAFAPRRFQCSACSHRVEWRGNAVMIGGAHDPYLRLPLQLQTRTRHGVLYAYNAAHLDWIEAFVAAPLRERRIDRGMANRSIASRLPTWIKAAKNRDDVLRALGRLRRCLAEAT